MSKVKVIPGPILMLVTILVVTGFQVYWLKDSYEREQKSLQIKSNIAFQDAVRSLQAVTLKLHMTSDSPLIKKIKFGLKRRVPDSIELDNEPEREVIKLANVVGDKVRDSIHYRRPGPGVFIAVTDSGIAQGDTFGSRLVRQDIEFRRDDHNKFYNFLYNVDAMQDSLKLRDIDSAVHEKLNSANLTIPFTVSRRDTVINSEGRDLSTITIGLSHPVSYHFELGNSFSYLLRQIAFPILFSLFLVGVTIVSFVLLYRNLLKQRRLADLKNEFIGNITHELKTPIATVSVAIEALKNFNAIQDPTRTREYLDISSNELQRLSLLVDKVLKLSMFEKKAIDLKFEFVDLRELVDEVVTSMRLQIEKFNASVTVIQNGEVTLEGDRLHLLSVVFNLLDNALKYSKNGAEIHIELDATESSVQLSIRDDGIGIAPEYKNKIFDKFFRVPTGDTHNAKGYGLGLSYVAQVVEKHHGKIEVESELNKGTAITLTFPKTQA